MGVASRASPLLCLIGTALVSAAQLTTKVDIIHGFHSINVTMGTPPQHFCLALQTSTGQQMIAGTNCTSEECKKMPSLFSEKSSSTYEPTDYPFIRSCVGQDACIGFLGRDNAEVLGSTATISIRNTTFDYADFIPKRFPAACSGLWGLGMVGNAPLGTPQTPLTLMKQEGIIPKELFSLYIDGTTGGGEINWGWVDTSKHIGPMFTVPMDTDFLGRYSYYLMTWEAMYFRGKKLAGSFCVTQPCKAVLDNLPQVFIGPKKVVEEFEKALNVSSDCSNYDSLPDIQLVLPGPHQLAIPPSIYINKIGATRCEPAFYGDEIREDWIFGAPFFKAFYTVFDVEAKTFMIGESSGRPPLAAAP